LILRAAYGILRETAASLTDVVVADRDQIEAIAESVPGVQYVHRVRSRGTPSAGFVDLHVKVYPAMSTGQAHAIASEVERRLEEQLPNIVDALVHIEPGRHDRVSDWDRIAFDLRQIADGMGMGLHDLHVRAHEDGDYSIELHLEIPGEISLGEAHSMAERFEDEARARWTRASSVITHLEPIAENVLPAGTSVDGALMQSLQGTLAESIGEGSILELQPRRMGEHISVAVRVAMPANTSLTEAHSRAEEIERDLLIQYPQVERVTVHVEPTG
jgi:divalent metal cation (Fe/Co/Zn/Cd) transporter